MKCIKTNDKEKNCGTCKYASTDGFFAPCYWCNKEVHHGYRKGVMFMDGEGTVCDEWEKKPSTEI